MKMRNIKNNKFKDVKILCVGDVILDSYVHGDVERISPEAPIPILKIIKESFVLGGAGNVARNICSGGGSCHLISVVGDDINHRILKKLSKVEKRLTVNFLIEKNSMTTKKQRYISGQQQILRVDSEKNIKIKSSLKKRILDSFTNKLKDSDLVIICTHLNSYKSIFKKILPYLSGKTIVSDVGSAKESAIASVEKFTQNKINFVPAHPIAGTEKSGPSAGFAELFENRWCIITPLKNNTSKDINIIKIFWKKLGSKVEIMTPSRHDRVMAITSHLPHLIAYNIVSTAADLENITRSDVIKYSASGFRDFTRIASSDPTMWRDVFLSNKDSVLEMISRFSEDLSVLQKAIRWNDGESLYKLFSKTKKVREKIIKAGQDTTDADFGRSKRK